MKKKLLTLLMVTVMSVALMACGGSKKAATDGASTEGAAPEEVAEETPEEEVAEETAGDYTEEQAAFVDEFNTMVDDYNVLVDAINADEELSADEEVTSMLNELTDAINECGELISDPANLTEEVMEIYRTAFSQTYDVINQLSPYVGENAVSEEKANLQEIFTTAVVGADEAENTYWFLFDDEVTFGAFVILAADYTQSVNVVGEITSREDGTLVITDESTSSYIAFNVVEEGDDYLVVSVEDGNEVTLIGYDVNEAIDVVLAIDETTEILE